MKLALICIGLAASLLTTADAAWSAPSPATQPAARPTAPTPTVVNPAVRAGRTAAREQALADLDDPDPLSRIGALEDILASQDAVLIDFGLRKVLAGTDQQLKAMALRTLLANRQRPFNFVISNCFYTRSGTSPEVQQANCQSFMNRLSGSLVLSFTPRNPATGEFSVHASIGDKNNGQYIEHAAKVQGAILEMGLNVNGPYNLPDCFGRLQLNAAGTLEGRIACGDYTVAGQISLY